MCRSRCVCRSLGDTHADATALAGTKDFRTLESRHSLWHVNKDVATLLHEVFLFLTKVALSCTVDLLHSIQHVIAGIRPEVNKGIAQERLVIARTCMTFVCRCRTFATCCVEVFSIMWIFIVIHTVCTTKYLLYAALYIFHIGRSFEHVAVVHLGTYSIVTNTAVEIGRTKDLPAQVVTTIYEVTNVWETVGADIGLSMSEDISIARASKAVEDTSITQIDDTVTCHRS